MSESDNKLVDVISCEETRHSLRDDDNADDDVMTERVGISGTNVRRLLRRSDCGRNSQHDHLHHHQQGGESTPGSLDRLSTGEPSPSTVDHIPCFTVPTRGRRLQPEPWINHSDDPPPCPTTTTSAPSPYETQVLPLVPS